MEVNYNRPIVGVLGAKGGVGATTLAVNLAAAFGESGKTTLLDANLQQPDAAVMLACEPRFSLLDLLSRAPEIEEQVYQACCCPFSGRQLSQLISPPVNGQAGASTNLTMIANCLSQIQSYSDYWIFDLPRNLDRHLVTLLDKCDLILLIMEANLASLAAARRWFAIFAELGYPDEKTVVVINRVGKKIKYMEEQVLSSLAGRSVMRIPDAATLAEECSIAGMPVVCKYPRDSFSKAVRELTRQIESNKPDDGPQSLPDRIRNHLSNMVSIEAPSNEHHAQYRIHNHMQHHSTKSGTKVKRTGILNIGW